MGERRLWAVLAALVLLATACSDEATPPTLAPGTTTTTAGPTTSTSTTTSTTSTTTVVTTTEDPDVRFAEIERLVQETHIGRFQAIYDKDPEALLDWVGSQSAYDDSLLAMERAEFVQPPSDRSLRVILVEVLLDRPDCLVVSVDLDASEMLGIPFESDPDVEIYWPNADGFPLHAEVWQGNTPEQVWIEDCDLAIRGVTP